MTHPAVTRITIPKAGYGVEEGTLTEWLVDDGQHVDADDVIYVVETDKSDVEQASPTSGWIKILVTEGSPVTSGSTVAILVAAQADLDQIDADALAEGDADADAPAAAGEHHRPETDIAVVAAVPDARDQRPDPPVATPKARRLAAERGIDLHSVTGTGPDGQIRADDLPDAAPAATDAADPDGDADVEQIPLAGWRRATANRLMRSLRESAQLTTMRDIDVTVLLEHRAQRKASGRPAPSVSSYLVRAAALSLRTFPELNGSVIDDTIHRPRAINVSVAVETDRGVVTPVLRHADAATVDDVDAFIHDRANRARLGTLTADETNDGTFTVTGTGPDGADYGTPILNWPQIAILLTARVRQVAVLVDDIWVPRQLMGLCLTYDHRAVDGVPTVRFIAHIEKLCQDPDRWINSDSASS